MQVFGFKGLGNIFKIALISSKYILTIYFMLFKILKTNKIKSDEQDLNWTSGTLDNQRERREKWRTGRG